MADAKERTRESVGIELAHASDQKREAVEAQNFDRAAELRGKERALQEELHRLDRVGRGQQQASDGAAGTLEERTGNDALRRDADGRGAGNGAGGSRQPLHERGTCGAVEPEVGGSAHGLPAYMGGDQWPAPPGSAPHPWEEPRLVADLDAAGRKALAAFGNAWVPQAAVPALLYIRAVAA